MSPRRIARTGSPTSVRGPKRAAPPTTVGGEALLKVVDGGRPGHARTPQHHQVPIQQPTGPRAAARDLKHPYRPEGAVSARLEYPAGAASKYRSLHKGGYCQRDGGVQQPKGRR